MAQDTFSRSTSFGLDTDGTFSYVWVERDSDFATAADSTLHVDGSKVVMPDDEEFDSYVIDTPTLAKQGTASFDVFMPVLANPGVDYWPTLSLNLSWPDELTFGDYTTLGFGFEQADYSSATSALNVGMYTSGRFRYQDATGADSEPTPIEIDQGNWYTIKASYDITARMMGVKMWKRSDTEPDDYLVIYRSSDSWVYAETLGDGYDGKPWIDFWFWSNVESYLDNLTTGAFEDVPLAFSANAFIVDFTKLGSFSARAVIIDSSRVAVCEPFNATTAYGLGPTYPFIPAATDDIPDTSLRSTVSESASPVFLDGSKVDISTVSTAIPNTAYELPGNRALVGWLQLDFFVPAFWWSGYPFVSVILNRDATFSGFTYSAGVWIGAYNTSGSGGEWFIALRGPFGYATQHLWNPSPSTWYTVKLFYDRDVLDSASTRQMAIIKPQGAADTSAIVSTEEIGLFGTGVGSYSLSDRIVFVDANNVHGSFPSMYVDNLCWLTVRLTADAVLKKTVANSFTADAVIAKIVLLPANAVIRRTGSGSFSADAELSARHFIASAYITDNGLVRHYRDRDHEGTLLDTRVVLTSPVGPYPVGATLHDVLSGLWELISEEGVV